MSPRSNSTGMFRVMRFISHLSTRTCKRSPGIVPRRSGSSPRSTGSRASPRRWRSSFGDSKVPPGVSFPSSSNHRRGNFALADLFHASYRSTHPVTQRSEALQLELEAHHPITDDPQIVAKQNTACRNPAGPPPDRGPLPLIGGATEVIAGESAQVLATYTVDGGVEAIVPKLEMHSMVVFE
jgi:hypothetical protein